MIVQNTVALVTGANRGIGQALVEALLARGVRRVYAGARDPQKLASITALDPARVIPLQLDITNDHDVASAAARAVDTTLLINNAGITSFGGVLDVDFKQIEATVSTNYFGTLRVTRAFVPLLKNNGGGAIVNLLTIAALASMPALGGYCASKAAALSLTQALRAELKQHGITVHGVFPGPVDTDMMQGIDVAKVGAIDVARMVLDGLEAGEEDPRPDVMAQQAYTTWRSDPKKLERQFGSVSRLLPSASF